jgi:hypothetical protein
LLCRFEHVTYQPAAKRFGRHPAGVRLLTGALAHRRTTHAIANLRRIEVEFAKGPAQRVAVHSEFFCGLALVAPMLRQHLKDVPPLELPNRLSIRDSGTMHLYDQSIQFALQNCPHPGSFVRAAF